MLAAAADAERARAQWKRLNGSPLASTWLNSIGRESAEALISVLGGAPYFGDLIIQHPDWLASTFSPETLRHGRRPEGIQREVAAFLDALLAVADHPRALRQLRLFKQREHLRIVARDIGRFAPLEIITRELTDLAEICLAGVLRVARAQLGARFGEPWHQTGEQWRSTNFAIIGLGNLGGMELDHSTSLDLVFLYEEEGFVFRRPPKAGAPTPVSGFSNREFFLRLSETLVAEMGLGTEEGLLYRFRRRFGAEEPSGAVACPPLRPISLGRGSLPTE
jgi:[glutamine synthetase] adenylyltransferase / [glutamine synthetase]-adenylyl-L-tyrosine phosphorylase